ncbi:MAG: DUF6259 domain-containing protein [Armatimonadota bacterium]|nr:DUF6259 domain-containing protein [Armatimonadota bacterium]
MKTHGLVFAICISFLCARPLIAAIEVNGDKLVVATQRVSAVFRGGDLVRLTDLSLGARYCGLFQGAATLLDLRMLSQPETGLRCTGWRRISPSSASACFKDETRSVEMTVSACEETQEIVVRLSGSTTSPGVTGAMWGIRGLDLSKGRLVVPAYGGSRADKDSGFAAVTIDYPQDWEAQLAIWEGKGGGFAVYSTDERMRFKKLRLDRDGRSLDARFETEAVAPWPPATTVPELEWRIRAFKGDWREPAAYYRERLRSGYWPVETDAAKSWASDIRTVITLHRLDTVILDQLARKLDPRKTLIYLPSWRKDGYDVNYPDYTPRDGARQFTEFARSLGFRVMLHTDLPGVSPGNPAYASVKQYQVKDARTLDLVGWYWGKPETVPDRFAFINPAAREFRSLFVESLRPAVRELNPDAIHLDVSCPAWNDGGGLVQGRNYLEGEVELHRQLARAYPNLVFGGESLHELLAPYERFAQRWIIGALQPHPVSDFLFGERVAFYGYLGQPGPEDPAYLNYFRRYENQGVTPTLAVWGLDDLNESSPGVRRSLKWARLWQDHDLKPDWTGDWGNALFRLKGSDGAKVVVERTPSGARCRWGDEIVYSRVSGVTKLATTLRPAGWGAYDEETVYGLDPERDYWLDEDSRPDEGCHLSYLSDNSLLSFAQVRDDFAVFQLTPRDEGSMDLLKLFPRARTGTVFGGKDSTLEWGATVLPQESICGGQARRGVFQHPPWQSRTGETFFEYLIRVPKSANPELRFCCGLSDAAKESDGVTFAVAVNREDIWREHIAESSWHSRGVSLAKWRGKTVRLRFLTGPGPAGDPTWDHANWSGLRIVAEDGAPRADAKLRIPSGKSVRFAAPAAPPAVADGVVSFHDLPLPCSVVAFFARGRPLTASRDLLGLPHDCALAGDGIVRKGTVYGSGTIGKITCKEVSKERAINAHPPGDGQTVISWLVDLPDEPSLKLSFSAGIADGSITSGIGFAVKINGETLWTYTTREAGWTDGTIDIATWRGQTILVQLVTDSLGDNLYDWAHWADVVFR